MAANSSTRFVAMPFAPLLPTAVWFFRALYNLGFSLQVQACWMFVQQFLFLRGVVLLHFPVTGVVQLDS